MYTLFDDKPLFKAIQCDNKEQFTSLLKKTNVNQVDDFGWTPLMLAITYNRIEFINSLIKNGAIINKSNNKGKTPLIIAAMCGYNEIIKSLLENNNKNLNINEEDNLKWTPLMYAILCNHPETVKLLIEKKADIYKDREKLLTLSTKHNNTKIIALLNPKPSPNQISLKIKSY